MRKSISVDASLESEALRLILLCFASAIDELRPTNTAPELLTAARDTVAEAKKIVAKKEYFLERQFFYHPTSLPLYQDIRATFISGLETLWQDNSNVGGKLDRAFNSALYKIVRRENSLVIKLMDVVTGAGAIASELEWDWAAYTNLLLHNYNVKPVFGQEETHIALSQIFVPPRATFQRQVSISGTTESETCLVDLTQNMLDWIEMKDPARCIRLVRGGPGSGKSSFSKHICARLAENANFRPIFIELQRLPRGSSLADRASNLLIDREEVFRHNPLKKELLDPNRPTILVFDGLDELVVPKSGGVLKIAEDFWDELDELLESLNSSENVRVMALITGREPIMQAAQSTRRGRKLDGRDALKIVGLGEQHIAKKKNILGCSAEDQRSLWWQTYAKATGARMDTPPILTEERLSTLTTEPLLCYLIALSGKAEESHEKDISNINDVYEKLLQDVWLRVWGKLPDASHNMDETVKSEYRRVGPVGVFDNQLEFERVLEYISIAAWRSGESRTATLAEFKEAIENTEVEDIWNKFQESYPQSDADENFTTLALTFFFKQGEDETKGFEFTHRSFGEYLTSRSLWRYWHDNLARLSSIRRVEDLYDWVQLTASTTMTNEILNFLKNEFLRKDVKSLIDYRNCLSKCFELVLKDGFSVRLGDKECWRDAERKQKNAEGAMLCCLSAISVALQTNSKEETAACVGFERNRLGRTFLGRVGVTEESIFSEDQLEGGRNSIYRQALGGIKFSEKLSTPSSLNNRKKHRHANTVCDYDILRLFHSDLSFSDFSGAHLRACGLSRSKLHQTNFSDACLDFSISVGCDFSRAIIDNASFSHAILQSAIFSNLTIKNVSFDYSTLEETKFVNCQFFNVDFEHAILLRTDFSGANLSQVTGLKQSQINMAVGDTNTILPSGLRHPKKWTKQA